MSFQIRHMLLWLSLLLFPWLAPLAVADGDPPARVARLNDVEGDVSFAPAGAGLWAYAELNRPLTSGDQLWTGADSRSGTAYWFHSNTWRRANQPAVLGS